MEIPRLHSRLISKPSISARVDCSLDCSFEPVVQTSPLALAYTGLKEVNDKVSKKLLIQHLGSDFWDTFLNKLCVFVAFERMLYLGPTEEPVDIIMKTELNRVNGEAKNESKVVKEGQLICLDQLTG